MFDYQAGEKYKLTLIMVGVAGIIAGMFFTLLLLPAPDMSTSRHKAMDERTRRILSNPDISGRRDGGMFGRDGGGGPGAANARDGQQPGPAGVPLVDRSTAQQFMQNWLPRVWDLSARTAGTNQEEAIKWMTPECAAAYRQNIWSSDIASRISSSALQSEWHTTQMDVSENLQDGSVVVKVEGLQVLEAPTGRKEKPVSLEYMLKQTPDGMRVAGISEVTPH
jgi:hypothetical protein